MNTDTNDSATLLGELKNLQARIAVETTLRRMHADESTIAAAATKILGQSDVEIELAPNRGSAAVFVGGSRLVDFVSAFLQSDQGKRYAGPVQARGEGGDPYQKPGLIPVVDKVMSGAKAPMRSDFASDVDYNKAAARFYAEQD